MCDFNKSTSMTNYREELTDCLTAILISPSSTKNIQSALSPCTSNHLALIISTDEQYDCEKSNQFHSLKISSIYVRIMLPKSFITQQLSGWSAWLSGRTSVSGRRSFAVLRSTCSWRVTTYVGKPSATGQPTRPTQPFILLGSINE